MRPIKSFAIQEIPLHSEVGMRSLHFSIWRKFFLFPMVRFLYFENSHVGILE